MKLGINIDGVTHWPSADDQARQLDLVKAAGFESVRYPLVWARGPERYAVWEQLCIERGLERVRVWVRESGLLGPWTHLEGGIWQIGNEPDGTGDASWKMWPVRFSAQLRDALRELPAGAVIWSGGLCSGHPWPMLTASGFPWDMVQATPFHCYEAQEPAQVQGWGFLKGALASPSDLVPEMAGVILPHGKPLVITELGAAHANFVSPEAERAYWPAMLTRLETLGVEQVQVFCWSKAMHPDYGLRDWSLDGGPVHRLSPSWYGIRDWLKERQGGPERPVIKDGGVTMPVTEMRYHIDDDTRAELARRGLTPTSDRIVEGGGSKVFTTTGILYYVNGPATWGFVPFESAP